MKNNRKVHKFPLVTRSECRERRARRHAKQVAQEQQLIREAKQEYYYYA